MLRRIGLFSLRARSSASGPHGYQSTGFSACCRRYGLVSCARRLGIVRSERGRQFVGQSACDDPRSNYTALPRSTASAPRTPAGSAVAPAPWYRRAVPWWALALTLLLFITAAFAISPIRDAAT